MFEDPIYFYLIRGRRIGDINSDFKKILDYLSTYGDIGLLKKDENHITFSYPETPYKATLEAGGNSNLSDLRLSQQILLTCERFDNVSVNILKNVVGRIGFRIFNPQTRSYLVNDTNLVDLTTVKLEPKFSKIFKSYSLAPLAHYRNSIVFFAKDSKGGIHLINRHLLEFLSETKDKFSLQDDFSVKVANDIGHFIALFDRGLIPFSFYENFFNPTKVMNLSGFDTNNFERDLFITPVFFVFDSTNQNFQNLRSKANLGRLDSIKKHQSLKKYISKILNDFKIKNNLLAAKIARDIAYVAGNKGRVVPRLTISIFLDE